jgi:hypothetical protein
MTAYLCTQAYRKMVANYFYVYLTPKYCCTACGKRPELVGVA